MAIDTPKGKVIWREDFLGDALNGDVSVATVSSGGTAAITAVQNDGTIQLTTDGTDEDAALYCGLLNWRCSDGALRLEARVKISVITTARMFVGLSDATTETDLLPMHISTGTTWVTTATDAIGFCYSTDATTPGITCFWVAGGTDCSAYTLANLRLSPLLLPIADTYYTYILELQDRGSGYSPSANFMVVDNNGVAYTKSFTTSLTRTTPFCPAIGHQNSTATAHTTTIDYVEVSKSRGT